MSCLLGTVLKHPDQSGVRLSSDTARCLLRLLVVHVQVCCNAAYASMPRFLTSMHALLQQNDESRRPRGGESRVGGCAYMHSMLDSCARQP